MTNPMTNTPKSNYRQSGYKRKARDFYPTPEVYVEWLAWHWSPPLVEVWEPAVGSGHLVNPIKRLLHPNHVVGTDILTGTDFLKTNTSEFGETPPCAVITNPPYGTLGPKFVRHSLDTFPNIRYHVFLLPFDWDAAGTRADLFTVDSPFYMKIACNKRVKWEENSKTTGMHNYAWFIWDMEHEGEEPLMRYSPN